MSIKVLFNEDWEFIKQPLDTTLEEISQKENLFRPVTLPHDWLIENTNNLYENGTGWYRKRFNVMKQEETLYLIRFDGVYMDTTIYLNNQKVGEWKYGYSAFEMDLTPYIVDGVNDIKVSVRHEAPNSRWYTGAGIYRDVWFKEVQTTHIVSDGIYITATPDQMLNGIKRWKVEIDTEVISHGSARISYGLYHQSTGKRVPLHIESGEESIEMIEVEPSGEMKALSSTYYVKEPYLWELDRPQLYELVILLFKEGNMVQEERVTFGFRTLRFEPASGFYLNDKKVKLNGVCEHHDLGCLGAAYYEAAMRRKFKVLQAMGVNAVRTAHNMPAENMMKLADEMGILIVTEAFDMWEKPKTAYDYARFFNEWYPKDIASWVRRDRNHPSLLMWSIGNEIYDTHESTRGVEITQMLRAEVEKHDPKGHAPVTIGSNYMPWENAQKCAEVVKLAGYNYGEKYYEAHHEKHPDWVIYGSETGSVVQSRGIYHFPLEKSVLADDDQQCSALGNSTTSWGARSAEECIINERDCAYSCGQFLWSGHDYIGEPTPYHTKNAYFGQIDTAGFAKDSYYIYQAEWTDYKKTPMVHLFPYWDFNEGQTIDLRVCSNAPKVELFLNGVSQGSFLIDHKEGKQLLGHWQIPYTPGVVEAVAYDEHDQIIARDCKSSFGEPAEIVLKADKTQIRENGNDLAFIQISMKDANGFMVENANNRVKVEVSSGGRLLGLDNGDSTDYEGYKSISRKLFSGKLLAVIGVDKGCPYESIAVKVSTPGLEMQVMTLGVVGERLKSAMPTQMSYGSSESVGKKVAEEIPVRKVEIVSLNGTKLSEKLQEIALEAKIYPSNATDQKLIWSVVDDAGIPTHLASIEATGYKARVTAKGDGKFRIRCMSRSGTDQIRLISQLDFTTTGLGQMYLDPYQLISAGVYTYSQGTVGNGNEKGIATARDGETQVGFENIDFGSYGSDEITLPIFALSDEPYGIEIWEGKPREEGSIKVGDVIYQKPSIWNVYQEETYKLSKRLTGITTLCFVLKQKVHIKGFTFNKINRALQRLEAPTCDKVYGDHFKVMKEAIKEIGNNVTIVFEDMDFTEEGVTKITLCGNSPIAKNSIHLRVEKGEEVSTTLLEFFKDDQERTYNLDKMTGKCRVSFIFLPGSNFDFSWLQFKK